MVVPLSYRSVPMGAGSEIPPPARAAILKSVGKMGEIPSGEPRWRTGLSLDKQFVSRVAHGARRRAEVRTRPYPSCGCASASRNSCRLCTPTFW